MVRLLLIAFLLTGCISQKGIYQSIQLPGALLNYSNYEKNGYQLADTFIKNGLEFEEMNLLPQKPKLDTILGVNYRNTGDINKLKGHYEIDHKFLYWLTHQTVINQDNSIYNINDSIELLNYMNSFSIYFLGHLKTEMKYNSFLILEKMKDQNPSRNIKSIFQINHLNGKVTSIYIIANIINEDDILIKGWTDKTGSNYKFNLIFDESWVTYFSNKTLKKRAKRNEKIDIITNYCIYELSNEGRVIIEQNDDSDRIIRQYYEGL